jgi:hypothetical protein
VVFFLPITVQQLTAYSYDEAQIILGSILFYLFLNLQASAKPRLTLFGLTLCSFLLIKDGWDLLAFLPLALPLKKLSHDESWPGLRRVSLVIGLALLCILLIRLPTILTLLHSPQVFKEANYPALAFPRAQLAIIAHDPLYFFHNLGVATLLHAGFYLQGMVGSIPLWLSAIYLTTIVGITVWQKKSEIALSNLQTIILVAILALNYSYIQLIEYLTWTPVGLPDIMGTLGRYFLVFIPFIAVTIYNILHSVLLRKIFFGFIAILAMILLPIKFIQNDHELVPTPPQPQLSSNIHPIFNFYQSIMVVPNSSTRTLYLNLDNTHNIGIPYLIELKDDRCRHLLKQEYLDFNKAQKSLYPIKVSLAGRAKICVKISSLIPTHQAELYLSD